ncbi:MAG: hypothetical protein ABW321_34810, partial [Polyangiales bacterium]
SLGVAGRYINVERPGVSSEPKLREAQGFTLDASLRVAPVQAVQLYFGTYNMIDVDSVYAPFMLGGGGGVTLGDVAVIGVDLLADMTSYSSAAITVGGGLEVFAARTFPLRAGYSFDAKRSQHVISFGLGYGDNAVGLDISLRQDLGGQGDTRLLGSFRFYVN